MVAATLLIGILLDLLTAVMLSYVGIRVGLLNGGDVDARRTQWFWYGASAFMLLDGGFSILLLLTDVPLHVATAVLVIRRTLFTAGWLIFAGWLSKLTSGRIHRNWWTYTAILLAAVVVQAWHQGVGGYRVEPWSIELLPLNGTPIWVSMSLGIGLFVPAAFLAAKLLRMAPALSPVQAYRAVIIGSSVLLFCALITFGFWNNRWFWYGFLENRSVFSVATGVLMAMRPPFFLRWKGIPRMYTMRQFPGIHQLRGN